MSETYAYVYGRRPRSQAGGPVPQPMGPLVMHYQGQKSYYCVWYTRTEYTFLCADPSSDNPSWFSVAGIAQI